MEDKKKELNKEKVSIASYKEAQPSAYETLTERLKLTRRNFVYRKGSKNLVSLTPDQVVFGNPVKQEYGGHKIAVLDKTTGGLLRFQTPVMHLPFGLTTYKNRNNTSDVLELSFKYAGCNDDIDAYFTTIRAFDKIVYRAIQRNLGKWAPKMNRQRYKSTLWQYYSATTRKRLSKNGGTYPPRQAVKVWKYQSVMFDKKDWGCSAGDAEDLVPIRREYFEDRQWMSALIEVTGLWIGRDSFAVGYRLVQGRFADPPTLTGDSDDKPQTSAVCEMITD